MYFVKTGFAKTSHFSTRKVLINFYFKPPFPKNKDLLDSLSYLKNIEIMHLRIFPASKGTERKIKKQKTTSSLNQINTYVLCSAQNLKI